MTPLVRMTFRLGCECGVQPGEHLHDQRTCPAPLPDRVELSLDGGETWEDRTGAPETAVPPDRIPALDRVWASLAEDT